VSPTTVPGILVVYHRPDYRLNPRPFEDAATVREHIHAFAANSRFPAWEVNTDLGFPEGLETARPAIIVLHYSLFGSGLYRLGPKMNEFVRSSDAFKVAFFQDEFHHCRKRFEFVNDAGVDLVYTHVREQDIPQVWGRFTPDATARFNYPGYVDHAMLDAARTFALPENQRDIDVGYRGRPLTAVMGSGALEKSIIGERFRELAGETTLRVDIETSEEGRLYGEAWYRFLGRCKTVLGVESGTSYIDLEDEVHLDYAERIAEGRPVTLEALLEGPLGRWDNNFSYRTISPRHFEAAAFRICQVLFEGEYSGVLQPMVHYLPLKKDFSNFDQVVEWLGDSSLRAEITENAHRDLIRSGRYSYESFVHGVDDELIGRGLSPEIAPTQRTLMDDAVGRGRISRRVRTEARYFAIGVHAVLVRIGHRARMRLREERRRVRSGA
jgi:hypothetical protein